MIAASVASGSHDHHLLNVHEVFVGRLLLARDLETSIRLREAAKR